MYAALVDFMADGVYKGTLFLMNSADKQQADHASDLWKDFPDAACLDAHYRAHYAAYEAVAYVKKVPK